MAWIYKNKIIITPPTGSIGFIYKISRISYIDKISPKIYIGKKLFEHSHKSKISKREIKTTKTRKRVRIVKKDSGWQTYQSSCLPLQQDIKTLGVENFTFEILHFCKDKRELAYMEYKYMFKYNVLEIDSYNDNIGGRFFRKKQ